MNLYVLLTQLLLLSLSQDIDFRYRAVQFNNSENRSAKKLFIERLNDKEHMIVAFSKVGCFSEKEKFNSFIISKEGPDYYIKRNGEIKKITTSQVATIKQFESELDSISTKYKCTNGGYYLLRYKKETKNIIDNSCSWNGYDNLIKEIFD